MGLPFLVRSMEVVGQALVDMRDSVDPRVTLEVALIRLASPPASTSVAELLERVDRLERAISEKGPAPAPGAGTPAPPAIRPSAVQPGPAPTQPAGQPASAQQTAQQTAQPPGQPAPPQQTAGPAQARVALGAYLRGDPPQAASPPPVATQARPTQMSPTQISPAQAPPTPASPSQGISSATASASDASGGSLPSRDELTKVWGDALLDKLSRPAKVYMASGRFVEVNDGAAVFALPDAGLLARANNYQSETESALTAYFGRRVPLRLVLDNGAVASEPPRGAAPADEETYDLDDVVADIANAPTVPSLPAEERILQAFPGSVLDV
jgi:hypothetical protein